MLPRPGQRRVDHRRRSAGHLDLALALLPEPSPASVLIRSDAAGSSHGFLAGIVERELAFSIGFTITEAVADAVAALPEAAWTPAFDAEGRRRDGGDVAELTALMDLSAWPAGMRVIARHEVPPPRRPAAATDVRAGGSPASRSPWPAVSSPPYSRGTRQWARCEGRIRAAKDTGLANLELWPMAQNAIWCQIVTLAADLLTSRQLLRCADVLRAAEPQRPRLRLLGIAGRLVRGNGVALIRELVQPSLCVTGSSP